MTSLSASTVTLGGQPVTVNGVFPAVGTTVPPFALVGKDLGDVTLAKFGGKKKILNIFPSVDTAVCAMSVRHFNEAAGRLADTVVLCISADLPFAQARFCGAEGLEQVVMLSLMRGRQFLGDYGVEIASGPLAGLAARAVIVLDAGNQVRYAERVAEIKSEPDYESALKAVAAI